MSTGEEWEMFRAFDDHGAADVMCQWLLREAVPARVETRSLENAVEAKHCVFVHRSLAIVPAGSLRSCRQPTKNWSFSPQASSLVRRRVDSAV
jgi:hypothetical protein